MWAEPMRKTRRPTAPRRSRYTPPAESNIRQVMLSTLLPRLHDSIARDHLLISQFQRSAKFFPGHFPERNRLMAAISDVTAIIEAGDTSGTLHQAAECVRLGRWLFIAKNVMEDPSLKWPEK